MNGRSRVVSALLGAALLAGCTTDIRLSGRSSSAAPERWPDEYRTVPVPWKLFPAEAWKALSGRNVPGPECRRDRAEEYDAWNCRLSAVHPGRGNRDALSVGVTKYEPRPGQSAIGHAVSAFGSAHDAYADFPLTSPSPLGDEVFEVPGKSVMDEAHHVTFRVRNVIVSLQVMVFRDGLDKWDLAAERNRQTTRYASDLSQGLKRVHG